MSYKKNAVSPVGFSHFSLRQLLAWFIIFLLFSFQIILTENIVAVTETKQVFSQFLMKENLKNAFDFYEDSVSLIEKARKFWSDNISHQSISVVIPSSTGTMSPTVLSPKTPDSPTLSIHTMCRSPKSVSSSPLSSRNTASLIFKSADSPRSFEPDSEISSEDSFDNDIDFERKMSFESTAPTFDTEAMFQEELFQLSYLYLLPKSIRSFNLFPNLVLELSQAINEYCCGEALSHEENYLVVEKLIKEITSNIFQKLKFDSFERFLKSEDWMEWIESKDESSRQVLLHKISIPKGQEGVVRRLLYTSDELKNEKIREKDFQFVYQMANDEQIWKLAYEDENNCTAFVSNFRFISDKMDDKDVLLMKFEGYLPFSLDIVTATMMNGSYLNKGDHLVVKNEFIECILPNSKSNNNIDDICASSVLQLIMQFGPLLSKRELILSVSIKSLPHLDSVIYVAKSCHSEKISEDTKNKHRIRTTSITGHVFQRSAENETKYTCIQYMNLGGWLQASGSFARQLVKKRAKHMHQSLTKLCSQNSHTSIEKILEQEPSTCCYLNQVFAWNEENSNSTKLQELYKPIYSSKFSPTNKLVVRL